MDYRRESRQLPPPRPARPKHLKSSDACRIIIRHPGGGRLPPRQELTMGVPRRARRLLRYLPGPFGDGTGARHSRRIVSGLLQASGSWTESFTLILIPAIFCSPRDLPASLRGIWGMVGHHGRRPCRNNLLKVLLAPIRLRGDSVEVLTRAIRAAADPPSPIQISSFQPPPFWTNSVSPGKDRPISRPPREQE